MIIGSISFDLKNDIHELDRMCRMVERFGRSHGLSKKTLFGLNLVLEEIFTNIVHYGYSDEREHVIQVCVSCEKGLIVLCIKDDGIPFNLLDAKRPNLDCCIEDRRIGGLGIHLIKEFVDEILYNRVGNQNILTLKKNIC